MKKLIYIFLFFVITQTIPAQSISDTLIVAYAPAAPFIIQENDKLSGINIWLWEKVANDLNLEYKLIQMDFSELLEGLKEGSVDLCINPLTITSERSKKMEFTNPFYVSNSTIAVVQKSSITKFLEFFKSFFNINFLRGFLILLAIITLFGLATWFFEKKKNPEHFRPEWKGVFDGMWWAIVTMTTVGYGDKYPISRGGKVIALIWMFSGLLFISGLTASIASNLTVGKLSNKTENFNDYKERLVGSVKNSSSTNFLKDKFFKNIKLFPNAEDGLEDLSNKKIDAFLYDEPILKYRIKKNESFKNLQLLSVKFDLQLYAFGLPKTRVKLEQIISQKILEITESHEWQMVLNEYGLNEL